MEHIFTVLKGMALGMAFVIPGFSGGTMAVILKIYDRLIGSISLNLKKLKENIPFLITLLLGMAIGIFLTSVGLSWLFDNYPVATKLTLVGIIVGSLPMIWKECTLESKFKPVNIIPLLAAIGVMIVMFIIGQADKSADIAQTELSTSLALKLVGGGAVASFTMVIPGISGSLMLTIMGLYETAITAVKDFNFPLIIPVGIGAAIGILASAKLITILLKKFRQGTYSIIIGLIVGSILNIFPSDFRFNAQGIIGILCCVIGFLVPIMFDRFPVKEKK